MTKLDLWKLPDFALIFRDQRFQAILTHLKTDLPSKGDESGDWYRGVHRTIEKIEALESKPVNPAEQTATSRTQLYRDPRTENQPK